MIERIKGIILAGGKSERFGTDKRFFKFKEKMLMEATILKLKEFFNKVFIVCDDEYLMEEKLRNSVKNFNLQIVEDIGKYKGPLNGIYSFFKKTGEDAGLFIPVDMPFLPMELIRNFLNLAINSNLKKIIVISENKPLPIFIDSFFTPEMEKYLEKQNSIKGFLKITKEKYPDRIYFISEKELSTFGNPHEYLKNINIKEDLNDS